jgi:hypothetical protein
MTAVAMKQSCPQGLTGHDLKEQLGCRYQDFMHWMRGQTMSICDGMTYNHEEKRHEPTGCVRQPHGVVVYPWDVERFLSGLPVIDLKGGSNGCCG